jgi:hypothetical protein
MEEECFKVTQRRPAVICVGRGSTKCSSTIEERFLQTWLRGKGSSSYTAGALTERNVLTWLPQILDRLGRHEQSLSVTMTDPLAPIAD